jgi:antitoxin (DNA-binding transcriptional repressor) of toxin-antitoxin stability system
MRTVSLQEARQHLDELMEEAVAGEDVVIASAKGTGVRLKPVPGRELHAVKDREAYRESILELIEQARAVSDLDPKSLEKILKYDEDASSHEFGAPMIEIEELLSGSPDETEIRRKVVRALCRLVASLPVLDSRSSEEILSDEGEGFL